MVNNNDTITIPRTLVEQALEALREAQVLMERFQDEKLRRSAMEALRAALEQPQIQPGGIPPNWKLVPVAWLKKNGEPSDWGSVECGDTPLYIHPQPPRQPLTDEEVKAICYTGPVYAPDGKVTRTPEQYKREIADARMHGIRQAERAHGIGGEK